MKSYISLILIICFFLLLTACISTGSSTVTRPASKSEPAESKPEKEEPAAAADTSVAEPQQLDRKEYSGAGEAKGSTFLNARNRAIMNAVHKAVVDIIGAANEEAGRAKLTETLYNTKNPNSFIFKDTLESSRKESLGNENWAYECTVVVNLV